MMGASSKPDALGPLPQPLLLLPQLPSIPDPADPADPDPETTANADHS